MPVEDSEDMVGGFDIGLKVGLLVKGERLLQVHGILELVLDVLLLVVGELGGLSFQQAQLSLGLFPLVK